MPFDQYAAQVAAELETRAAALLASGDISGRVAYARFAARELRSIARLDARNADPAPLHLVAA